MVVSEDTIEISSPLASHISKSINEFYFMKGISHGEISKEDYCRALSEVARNLGLKIKIEEEIAPVPLQETPLEIINKTIDKKDLLCEMSIM